MKNTKKILMAGSGGDGVLLLGRILAEAAMLMDMNVTWFPSYGAEMRGGTANCTVIISDRFIGSPVASKVDTLIAMNEESLTTFESRVREGGFLLMNSSKINISSSRDDLVELNIPATQIATDAGSVRSANMVLLGAFLSLDETVTFEAVSEALISASIKDTEINIEAIRLGRQYRANKKG